MVRGYGATLMAYATVVWLARHPDGSTSDVNVSIELARTCLHLGCRRGCRLGVGLGEQGQSIIYLIILPCPPHPLKGVFPRRSTGRREDLECWLSWVPTPWTRALEAMKSFHDFDSVVTFESFARFGSITMSRTNTLCMLRGRAIVLTTRVPWGFNISIEALEARLRFPLYLVIREYLGWWRISPSQIASNS
ncbi:hypothetical protein GW17_00032016 [Ensete ventricosum]|nr:hypothetical protein GW17_00032016 [Ensete ventricosum]